MRAPVSRHGTPISGSRSARPYTTARPCSPTQMITGMPASFFVVFAISSSSRPSGALVLAIEAVRDAIDLVPHLVEAVGDPPQRIDEVLALAERALAVAAKLAQRVRLLLELRRDRLEPRQPRAQLLLANGHGHRLLARSTRERPTPGGGGADRSRGGRARW